MSHGMADGTFTVYLSPKIRGAGDNIRNHVEEFLMTDATFRVASQQISDRGIVNSIAEACSSRRKHVAALIESDYLYERSPVPADNIWEGFGDREENRQCFLALLRSGVKIRTDEIGSALQHVNLLVAEESEGSGKAFLTSANLSPGSLNKHFNWGLAINDIDISKALTKVFNQAWDGDFRDADLDVSHVRDEREISRLAAGAKGQAVDLAVQAIESAQDSIRFAYFNCAKSSRVADALIAAASRNIRIVGIVDGDQQGSSWDAVPMLCAAGIDARYYPGALTGAIGRMHYKTIVVDSYTLHLSTANASKAAESSLELGITLRGDDVIGNAATYVKEEIARLSLNAIPPERQP